VRSTLREMLPADLPAVLERVREQNERDGTSYPLPLVFDEKGQRLPNIALALVAVDIETGRVEQGLTVERTCELMLFGTNAKATVCSMHESEAIWYLLRERGLRDVHILVPPERTKDMQHGLESIIGMSATGLTHFYRLLDPAENAELQDFYQQREVTA
jgi:hypothetical protein